MAPQRPRSLRSMAFRVGRRSTSPGPPSPTFSDTTHASAMNFGADGPEKIITRTNLKASVQAYEELMTASQSYREALMMMSKATAAFANAMESCSGLKGPSYEAGARMQAAGGLHHLIGNHWHVLAETIDKKFEKPLRQHLDSYRAVVNERSASYEKALREKSQIIRDTEMRNMNRKERNLQTFREALAVLQRQVDELDELKITHYRQICEHEEQVWDVVQGKVCIVVRSTMEVFDRFTSKASDPVIEPMLQSVPDPFDSYGPPQAEDQIFSILAPLSIMTNPQSSSPSPMTGTPERDAAETMDKVASWLPQTNNGGIFSSESTEWASTATVTSPSSTPPRSVSPPSVPNRRHSAPPIATSRKSESKLRSVLPAIEESQASQKLNGAEDQTSSNLNTPSTAEPEPSQVDTGQPATCSTVYGHPQHETGEDATTPRSSTLFPQATSPPDPMPAKPDPPDELENCPATPLASPPDVV